MTKRLEYLGRVILDKRQKQGVPAFRQYTVERNKYKPHTGAKQLSKANDQAS